MRRTDGLASDSLEGNEITVKLTNDKCLETDCGQILTQHRPDIYVKTAHGKQGDKS
jgi:hypothetical protein